MHFKPRKIVLFALIAALVLITIRILAVVTQQYGFSVGVDLGLIIMVFGAFLFVRDLPVN